MVSLTELWLPILLSAVFVFIVSSIVHMVIQLHKGDFMKVPGEDQVLAEMRNHGIQPGSYMFPFANSMQECSSPEMMEKYKRGPVGYIIIRPSGGMGMGQSLLQWFIYSVFVGVLVAYVGTLGAARATAFMPVFKLTGAAAIMSYALGVLPDSIWKGVRWSITAKFLFDGVLYGLVTGATFAWLWPAS